MVATHRNTSHRFIAPLLVAFFCAPHIAWALTGDVDGDTNLSVSDVQCLVLTVLDLIPEDPTTTPPCLASPSAADLDCTESTNVVDIQLAVSVLLGDLIGSLGMPEDSCRKELRKAKTSPWRRRNWTICYPRIPTSACRCAPCGVSMPWSQSIPSD